MKCPQCQSDKLLRSGWTKTNTLGITTRGVSYLCSKCHLCFSPPVGKKDEEDIT